MVLSYPPKLLQNTRPQRIVNAVENPAPILNQMTLLLTIAMTLALSGATSVTGAT